MPNSIRCRYVDPVVLMFFMICLAWPLAAQELPGEADPLGPIIRVAVVDLKVLGEREPQAVRQAFNQALPALAECLQKEYQRVGKVPQQIVLRVNLSSSGKVVWCKLIEPPLKSLEACLNGAVMRLQFPPAGESLSRLTVVLAPKLDHLLAP